MGSDSKKGIGAYDDEKPQHSMSLAAYQIGKYPVTVAEYACFIARQAAGAAMTGSGQYRQTEWDTGIWAKPGREDR